MTYILRALEPEADLEHFRTAYNWRTARRRERGTPVIPFEEFASYKPNEVSFGLFNGELLAVYLIQQRGPGVFEAHFAARRHAPKEALIQGARALRNSLFGDGAVEIFGYVMPEHARPNHPLRRFAESVGFLCCGETIHAGKVGEREIVMMKLAIRR